MPPRQILSSGLLILPFLAPRVFKPWPKSHRSFKVYAQAATAKNTYVKNTPRPFTNYKHKKPNLQLLEAHTACMAESIAHHSRAPHMRTEHDGDDINQDCFRRAYENIWGPERANWRFKGKSSVPPKGAKDVAPSKREKAVQAISQGKAGEESRSEANINRTVYAKTAVLSYRRFRSSVRRKIRLIRSKHVRLAFVGSSRPDSFSSFWSIQFTRLNWKYDRRLSKYEVPHLSLIPIVRGPEETRRFNGFLSNAHIEKIREEWNALSQTERDKLWPQVMLYALQMNPESALKFLVATSFRPYPPSYAISDSLEYIVSYYLHDVGNVDVGSAAILFHTVMGLLNYFENSFLHVSQKTIYLLLSHLPINDVQQFYMTLVQRNHPIHENTLLNFVHVFAKEGRVQLALDVLKRLHDDGGNFADPKVESVCAKVLRHNRGNSDGTISDSDIFRRFLDLGLQPNIIFYNILLHNALEAGFPEIAWQIHDTMLGRGIHADATTYSILLNDAKLRGDRSSMERVANAVKSKKITNEYIITDLLHSMFLTYEIERREASINTPPPPPHEKMLRLYAEYFDLEPIKDLLTQDYRGLALQFSGGKMHPPKETLVVIFIALLRGFTNCNSAREWYHRFRTMILSGHPDIAPLAESTHIYDAVIMCLGRWESTLPLCTEVIGHMLSNYSAARSNNRESLQTIWDSRSALTLVESLSVKGYRLEDVDSMQLAELDWLSQENSAMEVYRNATPADENLPRLSKSASSLPVQSNIVLQSPMTVVERSEQSNCQTVSVRHCRPSVRTWSILLKVFMDHRQPRAAEKVLGMMRSQGIKPNRITWNSLSTGYARLQDIASAVNVIERSEDEGWEVDPFTIGGLQAILDRNGLMQALQEKDQRRRDKLSALDELELTGRLKRSVDEVVAKAHHVYNQEDEDEKNRRRASKDAFGKPGLGSRPSPRPLRLRKDEITFPEVPSPVLRDARRASPQSSMD